MFIRDLLYSVVASEGASCGYWRRAPGYWRPHAEHGHKAEVNEPPPRRKPPLALPDEPEPVVVDRRPPRPAPPRAPAPLEMAPPRPVTPPPPPQKVPKGRPPPPPVAPPPTNKPLPAEPTPAPPPGAPPPPDPPPPQAPPPAAPPPAPPPPTDPEGIADALIERVVTEESEVCANPSLSPCSRHPPTPNCLHVALKSIWASLVMIGSRRGKWHRRDSCA